MMSFIELFSQNLVWIPVVILAVIAVVAVIRDYREDSRSDFR